MTETDSNFNKINSELRQVEEHIHSLELALAASKEASNIDERITELQTALGEAKHTIMVLRHLQDGWIDVREDLEKLLARRNEELAYFENELFDLRKALNQDEHYCVFDDNGWSIEHLVSCRPNMTECEFHKIMHETDYLHKHARGRFVMKLTATDFELVEVGEGHEN